MGSERNLSLSERKKICGLMAGRWGWQYRPKFNAYWLLKLKFTKAAREKDESPGGLT